MSSSMWVDTEGLTRAAEGYTNLADNVCRIIDTLNGLAGLTQSFGYDYAGDQFRPNYEQGEDGVRDGLDGLQRLLRGTGEILEQLATQHREVEEQNTGITRELGDSIIDDVPNSANPSHRAQGCETAPGEVVNPTPNSDEATAQAGPKDPGKPPHYVRCGVTDDMGAHQ